MTTTQTTESGIDQTSGLEYFEASGSEAGIDWKIEAVESDHATLEATISVGSVVELEEMIQKLQDLRLTMARAERIRGEV